MGNIFNSFSCPPFFNLNIMKILNFIERFLFFSIILCDNRIITHFTYSTDNLIKVIITSIYLSVLSYSLIKYE